MNPNSGVHTQITNWKEEVVGVDSLSDHAQVLVGEEHLLGLLRMHVGGLYGNS